MSSGSLGPPGSEMGVVIVLCELLGSFREKYFLKMRFPAVRRWEDSLRTHGAGHGIAIPRGEAECGASPVVSMGDGCQRAIGALQRFFTENA